MPSRFLLVFLAILLDATILLAAKFGHSRFVSIAPSVGPSRRVLLTEKQIERKKRRKEERLKTREEERKKRQEGRNNGSNNNTTATNVTGDPVTNAPTTSTATSSALSSLRPTAPPTLNLTTQPSSTPSEMPIANVPSLRPSTTPSSLDPTSPPSITPSSLPTTSMPSDRPSEQASYAPTSLPSGVPSTKPSVVQTTIVCDDQGLLTSGLAMAFIRFKYRIEFQPSLSTDDAIDNVDTSVAQVVANAFLPCLQSSDDVDRRLDESTNDAAQTFELLAVDSLPKDAVSTTETCTAEKGNWNCVIVQGVVTTYSNDLEHFDLNAVLSSIETSSLSGSLNLPGGKSVVTYLSPTTDVSEPIQQAPALPSAAAQGQEESPSSSPRLPNYVYGIAVASAFVGSVAVAFLVFRYRQRLPPNGALQADREGNLQPPEHQDFDIGPSQYEYPARGRGGGGGDSASYMSEDTFWRSIVGKRARESSSNYQPSNAHFESDASIALSSIGASFKGAMGLDDLEDDIDIESCGSSTIDNPSCLAEVAASFDDVRGQEDGRGKKWIDRLGIFANPK